MLAWPTRAETSLMPLSNKRKAELADPDWRVQSSRVLREKYKYGQKHRCEACGAVHHFFDTKCHNQKCKHVGPLQPVKGTG